MDCLALSVAFLSCRLIVGLVWMLRCAFTLIRLVFSLSQPRLSMIAIWSRQLTFADHPLSVGGKRLVGVVDHAAACERHGVLPSGAAVRRNATDAPASRRPPRGARRPIAGLHPPGAPGQRPVGAARAPAGVVRNEARDG